MDTYSGYTVKKTMDLVLGGESAVADCTGKDITIFIGPAETGKSTSINALLGATMTRAENGDFKAEAPPELNLNCAKMGTAENGNVDCTVVPALYSSNASPVLYLDTRGFFDTRRDIPAATANSILMELALRRARSIRLVVLSRFHIFEHGVAEFNQIGEYVRQLLTTDNIDVCFLFNDYRPSSADAAEYNRIKAQNDPTALQQFIVSRIELAARRLLTGHQVNLQRTLESIQEQANYAGVTGRFVDIMRSFISSPPASLLQYIQLARPILEQLAMGQEQFQTQVDAMSYSLIIEQALKRHHLCYIDPLSQASLQNVKSVIASVQPIPFSLFAFGPKHRERAMFTQMVRDRIEHVTLTLQSMAAFLKYGQQLEPARQTITTEIQQHRSNLAAADHDTSLLQLYNAVALERSNDLKYLLADFEKRLQQLKREKDDFVNGKPRVFCTLQIRDSLGDGLWTNAVIRYPPPEFVGEPYVDFVEELTPETHRVSLASDNKKFEARYTSATNWEKTIKKVADYASLKLLHSALQQTCKPCHGDVHFLGKPEDVDPQWLKIKDSEIMDVQAHHLKTKMDLEELTAAATKSLQEKIELEIKKCEENFEAISKFIVDAQVVRHQWDGYRPPRDTSSLSAHSLSSDHSLEETPVPSSSSSSSSSSAPPHPRTVRTLSSEMKALYTVCKRFFGDDDEPTIQQFIDTCTELESLGAFELHPEPVESAPLPVPELVNTFRSAFRSN